MGGAERLRVYGKENWRLTQLVPNLSQNKEALQSVIRNQPRYAPLAHLVDRLRPLRWLAPCTRPHSFFATISCNT